ncbi:GNAT family N-acetyltransferase [Amycolatopsis sp. OK19-0408]|uniref:GNAT family N-acetyltransferase n=1 Tax=Amycolatopsis iheyensis TaxID=2945988 RepID=A0A9X2NL87_9PSEU|nr:GNAT family N-acetyltransferase [Amycolatopsis iheyensis]MCR6489453.1 GNAT family N-acetyltransferase [Amycolatopsis iheyensis]
MRLTEDVDEFLAHAGDFLRSRPALHTMPLTTVEKLRKHGSDSTTFGWLEHGGEVQAIFYRRPTGRLTVTALSAEQAGTLAAGLAELSLSGVTADDDTATAFAAAWQRRTGRTPVPRVRVRLHRLGTLTPPEPHPEGRAAGRDQDEVVRWCGEFAAAVGETVGDWDSSRFAGKHYTFWETGEPVAMAGTTSMVAGMVRVDPVYTPARFRGRGYGGAVTAEVSRAALAAGARDVVLFTDPGNATSNALYQRIGYMPIADFTGYDFG